MDYFTQNIGNSSWYSVMSTYVDVTNGQRPTSAQWMGSYFVNSTAYATVINQVDIEAVMRASIATGVLPVVPSAPSNCYNFFASSDVSITRLSTFVSGGVTYYYNTVDCIAVCGYHSYFSVTVNGVSARIKYTVNANVASNPKGCGCAINSPLAIPNGNIVADSFVRTLSHEISEVVLYGWDASCFNCGNEIADTCNASNGAPTLNKLGQSGPEQSYGDFLYIPGTNPLTGATVYGNLQLGSRLYHVQKIWANYGKGCCTVTFPLHTAYGEVYTC